MDVGELLSFRPATAPKRPAPVEEHEEPEDEDDPSNIFPPFLFRILGIQFPGTQISSSEFWAVLVSGIQKVKSCDLADHSNTRHFGP